MFGAKLRATVLSRAAVSLLSDSGADRAEQDRSPDPCTGGLPRDIPRDPDRVPFKVLRRGAPCMRSSGKMDDKVLPVQQIGRRR